MLIKKGGVHKTGCEANSALISPSFIKMPQFFYMMGALGAYLSLPSFGKIISFMDLWRPYLIFKYQRLVSNELQWKIQDDGFGFQNGQ